MSGCNYPRGNTINLGGNCPGELPRWQFSLVGIVRGTIVRRAVVLVGNCPEGNYPGGSCPGAIVEGEIVLELNTFISNIFGSLNNAEYNNWDCIV